MSCSSIHPNSGAYHTSQLSPTKPARFFLLALIAVVHVLSLSLCPFGFRSIFSILSCCFTTGGECNEDSSTVIPLSSPLTSFSLSSTSSSSSSESTMPPMGVDSATITGLPLPRHKDTTASAAGMRHFPTTMSPSLLLKFLVSLVVLLILLMPVLLLLRLLVVLRLLRWDTDTQLNTSSNKDTPHQSTTSSPGYHWSNEDMKPPPPLFLFSNSSSGSISACLALECHTKATRERCLTSRRMFTMCR